MFLPAYILLDVFVACTYSRWKHICIGIANGTNTKADTAAATIGITEDGAEIHNYFHTDCTNWSNLVAVMDWGGANSRFLGLVSVWAARSFDQTALRPSVIKRIRQIDVKIHNTYHKLRCHCVNTSHCVNMHV